MFSLRNRILSLNIECEACFIEVVDKNWLEIDKKSKELLNYIKAYPFPLFAPNTPLAIRTGGSRWTCFSFLALEPCVPRIMKKYHHLHSYVLSTKSFLSFFFFFFGYNFRRKRIHVFLLYYIPRQRECVVRTFSKQSQFPRRFIMCLLTNNTQLATVNRINETCRVLYGWDTSYEYKGQLSIHNNCTLQDTEVNSFIEIECRHFRLFFISPAKETFIKSIK